ncbi:hypothetical protein [Leptolyngbya sp. FACHB-711]|uniref:hypothetical protein n=1 Tax=Leptolyngbya sp. FACHB-711 TaxID=2692813 RepID=UPI001687F132|nr:hypothetical protein [Leptolyngbya sp. FACHB-711]MBD2027012.1 hypothetical protein [Leptolyngbya sp. FACHB-711]
MPKRASKPKSSEAIESTDQPQWLTVTYQPVSLFSLKRSDATSMAARSNLVPTPYAIKMALLRVLLEEQGRLHTEDFDRWIKPEFAWIRELQVFVLPPEKLVVNRNGYKLRYYDQTTDKADRSRITMPLQEGFVFREWVHLEGNLKICTGQSDRLLELEKLFCQINYFGKRGCFFQFLPDETQKTAEPLFQSQAGRSFTVQPMDDLGAKTTFSRINPFSPEKAQLDKDRVIQPGFLPLQLTATSARYDFYTRF